MAGDDAVERFIQDRSNRIHLKSRILRVESFASGAKWSAIIIVAIGLAAFLILFGLSLLKREPDPKIITNEKVIIHKVPNSKIEAHSNFFNHGSQTTKQGSEHKKNRLKGFPNNQHSQSQVGNRRTIETNRNSGQRHTEQVTGSASNQPSAINNDLVLKGSDGVRQRSKSNNKTLPTDFGSTEKRLSAKGAALGVFNISLKWNTHDDLDLKVIEPNVSYISYMNPVSKFSGAKLDVDANSPTERLTNEPIENITWFQKPSGSEILRIVVTGYKRNTQLSSPVPYQIVISKNGKEIERLTKTTQLPTEDDPARVVTEVLTIIRD